MDVYVKKQQESWNENAKNYSNLFRQVNFSGISDNPYPSIKSEILYFTQQTQKGRLLEVGCGNGLLLKEFAGVYNEIFGTDFSEELIERAKKDVIPSAVLKVSEAAIIPFEDNFFDCVISNSVFQYFPDEKYAVRTIEEMLRVLKPGGVIFIGDVYNKRLQSVFEKNKNIGDLFDDLKKVVKKLLNFCGFGNYVFFKYLFLEPEFFFTNFHKFVFITPKLIVSEKPELFKKFRFDVLMVKK